MKSQAYNYPGIARMLVCERINNAARAKKRLDDVLDLDDVYVVQFAKILQNWKALMTTSRGDGTYYELTYDGDMETIDFKEYKHSHSETIEDLRNFQYFGNIY